MIRAHNRPLGAFVSQIWPVLQWTFDQRLDSGLALSCAQFQQCPFAFCAVQFSICEPLQAHCRLIAPFQRTLDQRSAVLTVIRQPPPHPRPIEREDHIGDPGSNQQHGRDSFPKKIKLRRHQPRQKAVPPQEQQRRRADPGHAPNGPAKD